MRNQMLAYVCSMALGSQACKQRRLPVLRCHPWLASSKVIRFYMRSSVCTCRSASIHSYMARCCASPKLSGQKKASARGGEVWGGSCGTGGSVVAA